MILSLEINIFKSINLQEIHMKTVILSTTAIAIALLMQGCSAPNPGGGGVGKLGTIDI